MSGNWPTWMYGLSLGHKTSASPVVHAKRDRPSRSDDHPHPHPNHTQDDPPVDPLDIYDILLLVLVLVLLVFLLILCLWNFARLFLGGGCRLGGSNHARDIRDPEHPYSPEQLSVLSEESISVDDKLGRIMITFTPTIQHCSVVTVIGLCLRVKLKDFFPLHFKVDIKVAPGSHADKESVNKQLNDKERVAAALENPNLRRLVDECLYSSEL